MSYHVIAYFATNGGAVTNFDTPFLADLGVVPTFNGHALLPGDFLLTAAAATGATITRARLDSGQLRVLGNAHLFPLVGSILPGNNPNIAWFFRQPWRLPQREEIAVQITDTAADTNYAVLFLSKTIDTWMGGNIWIVRSSSATATVAQKWTNIGQPTMETALPVGTYQQVWADAQSTNLVAARWLFPPTVGLRPGWLGLNSLTQRSPNDYYLGALGAHGYFVNDVLPFIEILANVADAAFEFRQAIIRTQSSIGAMAPMGPLGVAGP